MAHITDSRTGGFHIFERIAALRSDMAERLTNYRNYTRTLRELESLNFRELSDLGLANADLNAVAYETVYGK